MVTPYKISFRRNAKTCKLSFVIASNMYFFPNYLALIYSYLAILCVIKIILG